MGGKEQAGHPGREKSQEDIHRENLGFSLQVSKDGGDQLSTQRICFPDLGKKNE